MEVQYIILVYRLYRVLLNDTLLQIPENILFIVQLIWVNIQSHKDCKMQPLMYLSIFRFYSLDWQTDKTDCLTLSRMHAWGNEEEGLHYFVNLKVKWRRRREGGALCYLVYRGPQVHLHVSLATASTSYLGTPVQFWWCRRDWIV